MRFMQRPHLYVTTPLYYVNAKPHLGHAYATILADTLIRHARQRGVETYFLTGTDEHGEKIAAMAKKENRPPQEFCNEITGLFKSTWQEIGLKPDVFYRTMQPSHYALVSRALQRLKDKGDIYFGSYEGKYCVGCERFRTDKEWNEKGVCPDHLTPPELRKESNYFFKMSAYQERLIEHYRKHPETIVPANYLKETMAFLEQPLEDFSISRPIERLSWGIPLPFDKNYVTYVWFDALLSYLGGLGYTGDSLDETPGFRKDFWENSCHVLGKDILKTHAIYWPTMLMALGVPVFKRLQVSGFWMTKGLKMSKSLGNVVDPKIVNAQFGMDPFRYYLLREMSYGSDGDFTWESFIQRANSDLANGLGNLASRVLTLTHKNCDAKVPSNKARNEQDLALLAETHALPALFAKEFDASRYHMALAAFSEAIAKCDRYINDQKPWALAKDPASKPRLEAVLGTAMDCLWTLHIVGASVLTQGAVQLRLALGAKETLDASGRFVPAWAEATKQLEPGTALGPIPRLYPRLELPKDEAKSE